MKFGKRKAVSAVALMRTIGSFRKVSQMVLVVSLMILGTHKEGLAATALFDFSGPCISNGGLGCAAFGLASGDLVGGTLAIDETLVVPNTRLILNLPFPPPLPIDWDFSFTFGNFVVSKADVLGSFGSDLEVFFLPPGAHELNALSGPIPSQVLTDGSKFLGLGPDHFAEATQVFLLGRNVAFANGSWLRRSEEVPEPATLVLLAVGVVAIGGMTRTLRQEGRQH